MSRTTTLPSSLSSSRCLCGGARCSRASQMLPGRPIHGGLLQRSAETMELVQLRDQPPRLSRPTRGAESLFRFGGLSRGRPSCILRYPVTDRRTGNRLSLSLSLSLSLPIFLFSLSPSLAPPFSLPLPLSPSPSPSIVQTLRSVQFIIVFPGLVAADARPSWYATPHRDNLPWNSLLRILADARC